MMGCFVFEKMMMFLCLGHFSINCKTNLPEDYRDQFLERHTFTERFQVISV